MEIFISWSGPLSQRLANVLGRMLFRLWPGVETYLSGEMTKGAVWAEDLLDHLRNASVGLVCVTPGNTKSPWLHFEAGVLAKSKAQMYPVLFGVEPQQLGGPMACFQLCQYGKVEFRRMVMSINGQLGQHARPEDELATLFEQWWISVREELNGILFRTDLNVAHEPLGRYLWRVARRRATFCILMSSMGDLIKAMSLETFRSPTKK